MLQAHVTWETTPSAASSALKGSGNLKERLSKAMSNRRKGRREGETMTKMGEMRRAKSMIPVL